MLIPKSFYHPWQFLTQSPALATACRRSCASESPCVYRKPKPAHYADEAHQGLHANLLTQSAELAARLAHLCPMIDVFWFCCNSGHRLAGFDVSEPHSGRRDDRGTRAGSIRSAVRQNRSAKATLARWACPECPWLAI